MSFQPRQTPFIFGTQIKIFFDEFWELSYPPIDSNVITTIKVQKCSKEIVKIIHVTSGVQPVILRSYAITFCMQRNKK